MVITVNLIRRKMIKNAERKGIMNESTGQSDSVS